MKTTRCQACNGKKVVAGLGNMLKKCEECSGVGYVTISDSKQEFVEPKSKSNKISKVEVI